MSTKPRPLAPSTLAILNLPHHLPAWKAIAMPETDKLLEEAELKMEDSIDAIARSLASIRTGRANPALIEGLQIDYYGTSVTLNQLASISVPEARLLMVQPWDKRSIPAVEKSILKADLGLNPSSDGELIRIPHPPPHRRTAQGPRQASQPPGRGGPRQRPDRPTRICRPGALPEEGQGDLRGRGASRHRTASKTHRLLRQEDHRPRPG